MWTDFKSFHIPIPYQHCTILGFLTSFSYFPFGKVGSMWCTASPPTISYASTSYHKNCSHKKGEFSILFPLQHGRWKTSVLLMMVVAKTQIQIRPFRRYPTILHFSKELSVWITKINRWNFSFGFNTTISIVRLTW